MREFWDERAREDAFYFVDNRINYKDSAEEERFWEMGREDLDRLLGAVDVGLEPDWVVAEIGCGVGRLTRVISERVGAVKALDVSAEMLSIARAENVRLANVDWILGDGISLAGIDDGVADAVVSHVVFQHIPDPQITLGYIREAGRVLRQGGVAVLHVSNDERVHELRQPLSGRIRAALGRAPKGQAHAAWTGSAVDLEEVSVAAADGGMALEKVVGKGTQYTVLRLRRQ
ncbi:MAG TPA: class I SAM-dependent methyltransferase [Thermoleophilaceae bacterium]|nr:class I SAM-dependent methyltransferase [Thermoleophilaceae bacterium]